MRSMTGYGRGQASDGLWNVTVDVWSVNHRYLDVNTKLPTDLIFLHDVLRKEAAAYLIRGHLDMVATVVRTGPSQGQVFIDTNLADAYFEKARILAQTYGCEVGLTAGQVLGMAGVCTVSETGLDAERLIPLARQAADEALEKLCEMRRIEGVHLAGDLSAHLQLSEAIWQEIVERAPSVVPLYREKLLMRLESMQVEGLDPARVAQEVAIIADKSAVDEEIARLSSHFRQMHMYLGADGEIGKKMDFLIQEMNRETNTIGSKAMDAEMAQLVVDLKSEIEKMREQIQNVE